MRLRHLIVERSIEDLTLEPAAEGDFLHRPTQVDHHADDLNRLDPLELEYYWMQHQHSMHLGLLEPLPGVAVAVQGCPLWRTSLILTS